MNRQEILTLVLLLFPVLLVQLAVVIYALVDLSKRTETRGPRWAWAVALIVTAFGLPGGILTAGLYLAWARHTEPQP